MVDSLHLDERVSWAEQQFDKVVWGRGEVCRWAGQGQAGWLGGQEEAGGLGEQVYT